jgi:phosphoribosylanthranilate isomerase
VKRLRVKICGLTSPADAAAAAAAGADYLGVVLVPGRSRSCTVKRAAEIFAAGRGALRVGVFADAAAGEILAACATLRLDAVQLHGSESVVELVKLRGLGAPPLWKALSLSRPAATLEHIDSYGAAADAILVDGGAGGLGVPFDWAAFRPLRPRLPRGVSLVVAGGLTPGNVGEAIRQLAPDVVDVSSGVESVHGRKSEQLIHDFVAAARGAAPS